MGLSGYCTACGKSGVHSKYCPPPFKDHPPGTMQSPYAKVPVESAMPEVVPPIGKARSPSKPPAKTNVMPTLSAAIQVVAAVQSTLGNGMWTCPDCKDSFEEDWKKMPSISFVTGGGNAFTCPDAPKCAAQIVFSGDWVGSQLPLLNNSMGASFECPYCLEDVFVDTTRYRGQIDKTKLGRETLKDFRCDKQNCMGLVNVYHDPVPVKAGTTVFKTPNKAVKTP